MKTTTNFLFIISLLITFSFQLKVQETKTESNTEEQSSTEEQSTEWTNCAGENGTCNCTGTVRYGANGKFNTKTSNGSIKCSYKIFGDPIFGTHKNCECKVAQVAVAAARWTRCAGESGTCNCSGPVMYGARGKFNTKTSNGSISCSHKVFGDPIFGVHKNCYCHFAQAVSTAAWTSCAGENGTCNCNGPVRYGAKGKFYYKTSNGSIRCSNTIFGDPIFDTQKNCQCQEAQVEVVSA